MIVQIGTKSSCNAGIMGVVTLSRLASQGCDRHDRASALQRSVWRLRLRAEADDPAHDEKPPLERSRHRR